MMRFGSIILLFGIFILMGFSIESPEGEQFSSESVLIFKKTLNKKYDTGYHLDVAYPEVRCRDVNQGYNINKHIHQLTSSAITDFTKKVKTLYKPSEGYHYMNLNYTVHYTDSYTISVKFRKSSQFIGYKEASDLSTTFNYDLSSGKILRFTELFDEKSGFQKKLSNLLWKYEKVRIPSESFGNNTRFCMNSHFLTLYTINPSTNRVHTFQIKWSEITQLLNPENTVLARYAQN